MDGTGTSFDDLPENLQQVWERAVAEGKATGEIQETLATSAQDTSLAAKARAVLRAALDMVIQPTSRMPEDVAARKREFVAAYWGGARSDALTKVADDLGISKDQAKRWSAELPNFLTVNGQKIKAAVETVAKERGIDIADVLDGLRSIEEQHPTEEMVDEIEGTGQGTSATEEPLSSDQEDIEVDQGQLNKAPEEELNTAEADAGQNDFVISSRKSASLQEQNNAVETNQAKIMRLLDMQDKINEAESIENPPAPKIVSLSEAALEKLGGDVTKLKEHDLLNLAVNAKLTENFELADQLNAELSSRIEKALEKAQKQADQKTQKGTTNAVQEPSAEKVSVSEGAAGGQAVGKGVAKVGKATRVRKAKVEKPVEAKVEEVTPAVLTPKEQWDALTQQFPGMPPYDVLTKSEKETWDDFANRGFGDIGSVATVLGGSDKIAKASEAVAETAAPAAEPAAETAQQITSESVLDTSKYVYHAVRSDADLASIMKSGVAPGTNVSTSHNGQAFAGEGDTILVLPKQKANVTTKGYQNDSVIGERVFPVAILKDLSLVPTQPQQVALDVLGKEYKKVFAQLAAFDKTLGITEEQRVQLAVRNSEETKKVFGDFYDRIMQLNREEDRIFREMDRAESLPQKTTSSAKVLSQYSEYDVPVFSLDIRFNENTNTTSLKASTAKASEAVTEAAAPVEETVQEQVTEEVLTPQLEALPEAQVQRLETHYGEKRDSASFLAKVKEDVVLYATKGAQAVAGAIRDVIKAIHAGVLSVAMIFNPGAMSQLESFVVIPQETQTTTQQVLAEVPADVVGMSDAGKQAYATLIPALKGKLGDKFITIADKPSGRIFVFKADGSLVIQKKALFGLAKGDLYKGNNDVPSNRVTPAGLFGINIVDAAKGGAAAKTAGDYDFGKVFALDDPDATVTFMHSVWLKESDAPKRAAALKNESATDSRYSFGCINVDKDTFKDMVTKYSDQMDGSKLFVVPDAQSTVNDFITGNVADDRLIREGVQPVTRTTTTPVKSATPTVDANRTFVAKEEPGILASRGTFLDFEDIETQLSGVDLVREQLREAGIENALDFVSDWTLESNTSKDAWHGSLEVVGGRYVGSLNTAKLNNPKYAALVARHEISHAVDMAPHGGIYSAQPEMGVAVQNGQVVPTGNVAREMFALYQTDADWKDFLAYPFDIDQYPDLDNGTKIQIELFAQIMAVYTSPAGRAYIEAAAPRTAAYLKEVVNDIKSSKPLQIQKAEVAALRTISFQNRNQPSRNKTTGGLPPKDRVREEIGPLAAKGTGATVDAAVNLLPPKLRSPVRNTTTDLLYQAKKGMLASAITEDVINMASKFMKSAKTYLKAQYARQATRLNHELKIEKILQQFDKLPKNLQGTGEGSVNKYIFDSTREGKWGYIPVERMVGTTLLTVDPDMKKRYDAFPDDAKKLIRDVFEQGYDALDAKQNAVKAAVDREYADRLKAVQGDAELTDKLNKEKKLTLSRERKLLGLDSSKPYAYLGRYGDYVVVGKSAEYKFHEEQVKAGPVVKGEDLMGARSAAWLDENRTNPAHYVVQFAETLGEANQIADQLNATGNYDIAESYEKEPYSQEGGDLFLAVARLRTLFDKEAEGANPAAQASIRSLLGDLYLHTVSEASSRKSEFQRLNISGADQDMMRNLATRGRADAHFLAALEHNDAISDAITAMREERNRNRGEAGPYFNELLKRHANSMKYETPGVLSSALLRMSNVWYLATNPAYYLQQILQTGVLSLPYMSGRLGYFRSARAVKKAYGDMATLVKGLGIDDSIDFNKAPADVREMLTKLVGMGKIDIGIDSDARVRAGEAGVAAKVMQKLQGVNSRIEAVNRATAAIAAYRGYLDRYKNGDTAAATAYAADVVSNTHGSYDAFNTPRIMQTGAGKVLLQFKRFQIIQISMLLKLINTAFKGASRDEKAVARRALGFIAGHMMVLGGAIGVPLVQQFGSLLLKMFGDEDEPENLELTLRRLINDPVMADLLINGVPGALGVNLGSKLGMGNVFSILPFTDIDFTSRAGAEKMLVGIMGPSAGLGLKFADGLGQMASGEYYKGLESMLPSGVANVMKAGRFATEGITMRNGDVVLKPEEISMFDAAFQAVGLPTTTITDRQFTQRVVAEFDKFYDKRTTEIKGDYVEASRSGDVSGMADAREEWSKLQESRAKNGYKRQPLSDLFRAPSAAAKRERNIAGGVEFGKSNRQFVESLSTL